MNVNSMLKQPTNKLCRNYNELGKEVLEELKR